jgi:hypothetical protein
MVTNALSTYTSANDDFADVRQQDIIMPRIALQQATSAGVVDGKYKMGQFIDTAQETVAIDLLKIGKVVPLVFWIEWIEWNTDRAAPKDKRVVNRSTDPQSDLAKQASQYVKVMTTQGERLKVTEIYNFICLLPSYSGNYVDPFHIGFSKSSHATGKSWLNKLMKAKIRVEDQLIRAPIWANEWEISSLKEQKDGNTFARAVIGSSTMLPVELHADINALSIAFKERKQDIMKKNSGDGDEAHSESAPSAADMQNM